MFLYVVKTIPMGENFALGHNFHKKADKQINKTQKQINVFDRNSQETS